MKNSNLLLVQEMTYNKLTYWHQKGLCVYNDHETVLDEDERDIQGQDSQEVHIEHFALREVVNLRLLDIP